MSVISEVEQRVRDRMKELEPLIAEYRQLEELAATFDRSQGPSGNDHRPAAKRRPRRSASRGNATAGRSGARAAQALELVQARPGITVAELAEAMSIGNTYLYRIMPALQADGKVTKVGRGYEVAGGVAAGDA